jgi:Flp pilus assembly pilin Flp
MAISKVLFPPHEECYREDEPMTRLLRRLWKQDEGQDIAEYAVMLAVILVLVVGTIRLVGSNANNVFSNAASAIQ